MPGPLTTTLPIWSICNKIANSSCKYNNSRSLLIIGSCHPKQPTSNPLQNLSSSSLRRQASNNSPSSKLSISLFTQPNRSSSPANSPSRRIRHCLPPSTAIYCSFPRTALRYFQDWLTDYQLVRLTHSKVTCQTTTK